jgi:arylsulfatase A-like enzyme
MNGKGKKPATQYIMGNIVSNAVKVNSGFRGIRTKQFKFAYVKANGKTESFLFDLNKDPFELKNIYNPNSAVVKKLRKELIKRLLETKDSFEIPNE